MIRSIHLADTANYSIAGATVEPLTKCNFVYGPNGAGKTTLSRFLGEQKHRDFQACKAHWVDGRELETRRVASGFWPDVLFQSGQCTV